jgi:hypothetical protein
MYYNRRGCYAIRHADVVKHPLVLWIGESRDFMLFRLRKRVKGYFRGDIRVIAWDHHKLLYVRIPKSGNSSIRRAIDGAAERRMSQAQIAALGDDWTSFSFVRNPWSRLLSLYKQKASEEGTSTRMVDGVYGGFVDQGIPVRPGMNFEEFCDVVCEFPDYRTDKHLQSQAYTLIRNGQPIVPFIGKLESMNEDWKALMEKVGLDYELPHSNRTQKTNDHYSRHYTTEALIQKVADRYSTDIEYFGYEFERR